MRILILGGDGMLGHRLLKDLSHSHEVRVTLRREAQAYAGFDLFNEHNSYAAIDVRETDRLTGVLSDFHPDAVINAVGVIKQHHDSLNPIPNLEINALLPHSVAAICKTIHARFVHLSTDCVFSGRTGNYKESDQPDPIDVYGHSKLLGEVSEGHCITLRTSIIGRELARKKSLLEWFLAQRGTVHGFRQMIYTGFTTREMSRIVEKILVERPHAAGVYHVSSAPISKYDLLCLIKNRLRLAINIVPDDDMKCNRSLDSARFRSEFHYMPPTWEHMVDELARDIEAMK